MSSQQATPRRSYGTGSLYIRTDSAGRQTWYGHWRVNGRQVKKRIGPKRTEGNRDGLTQRQAEAELRKLMTSDVPLATPGEKLTVCELGDRYLLFLANAGRKPSTIAAVRGHLKIWIVPVFGNRPADSIRSEDVADLVALMRNGRRPGGLTRTKALSPKTIVNTIGTLNAMLAVARRKRWAAITELPDVELPSVEANEDIRYLTPAEVRAVAAAAVRGPYEAIDRALFLTAGMTGLRQGELIALRWKDVDWAAGRVRVRQNYVLGEFGTPKSRRSTRSVPMADAVAGQLDRLFQSSALQDDDDLVFADPVHHGRPMSKAAILRRFRAALKEANLDSTHRFHDLRHSFGTAMAAAGVPMRTLQEWMGHRDHQTTQRYADYAPSAQEAALVAAAFAPSDALRAPSSDPILHLVDDRSE